MATRADVDCRLTIFSLVEERDAVGLASAVYGLFNMKKNLLVFAVCSVLIAGTLGTNVGVRAIEGELGNVVGSSRVTFRVDEEVARIAALCDEAKANYSEAFRVRTSESVAEESNADLKRAEQDYFNLNCDLLAAAFSDYRATNSDESFEELVRSLGEVKFYQAKSPAVVKLVETLREQFSLPNFYVEASERFLSAMGRRKIVQKFSVQEYIRSTYARGNGVAEGYTSVQLRPNPTRAEMSIVLNARVTTNTIGTSRGVDVYTDNFGDVVASKAIFINSDGRLTTSLGTASGNLKTNVNSITPNRMTPFGGAIIQNKINQELPYSERESTNRLNQRVASELERETNAQLSQLNNRIARMAQGGSDSMIRNFSSRTSDSRLYLSFVLGRGWQFAAPVVQESKATEYLKSLSERLKIARDSRVLARARVNDSCSSEYVGNRSVASVASSNLPQMSYRRQGPVGAVLSAPFNVAAELASAFVPGVAPTGRAPFNGKTISNVGVKLRQKPVLSSLLDTLPPSDGRLDLIVRMHQSSPNNMVTVALAGAVFGPGSDTLDDVVARFPALDPQDVKTILTPYKPKEDRPLEPDDNYKNVSIQFDDVRPFMTRFDCGKINTTLRLTSCVVDGKEYPPVEVRLIYDVQKRGSSYAFVRESVDVLPDGFQEGETVSARFHTFRRIFMKRLEKSILDEYVVVPIPLDDRESGERRGALVPELIDVQNGWITLGFRYDPSYVNGTI